MNAASQPQGTDMHAFIYMLPAATMQFLMLLTNELYSMQTSRLYMPLPNAMSLQQDIQATVFELPVQLQASQSAAAAVIPGFSLSAHSKRYLCHGCK